VQVERAIPPVTVLLVMDQMARDAIGRDYGHRVFEHAREELNALAGVVLVNGETAGSASPDFRITYTNFSESPPGGPEPYIAVEMLFKVEAFRPGADGAGVYQKVFWSTPPPPGVVDIPPSIRAEYSAPSFDRGTATLMSSARVSFRPGAGPSVPVDCVEQREARCRYTPADIAAFTILSWRLETTVPDPMLAARLHAMLRDVSTPFGLWLMALDNLLKYKLPLDLPELLSALERVGDGDDDPTLHAELIRNVLAAGNKPAVMRWLRERLLRKQPNGDRALADRLSLVKVLTTEFRNEPDAQDILESVAATDPSFEVRVAAKRALGEEPEQEPRPVPAPSFMGPIEEQ
jgi:hypothetical protein